MGKILFILVLAIALIFTASSVFAYSSLQWTSQPNTLYNVGDAVSTSAIVSGTNFSASLICNNVVQGMQFPTFSNLPLSNLTIPIQFGLTPSISGGSGTCQIQALLDGISFYTSQFQISNAVNVTVSSQTREFKPGSQITISGTAIKQNGQTMNGVANINITFGNNSVIQNSASVNNGNFYFNSSLPPTSAAGQYLVNIMAYESDSSGEQTNSGSTSFNIVVDQVPTSLNIVPLGDSQSIPGQTYPVKAILYDQTGQEISSPVNFTVQNTKGEVMDQQTISTDQVLEIPLSYNDLPGSWSVFATSDGLNTQSAFEVLQNAAVSVDLINRTLLFTNTGNVPYNNVVSVEIGNQTIPFNVSLDVGQSQKYVLTAPSGNYSIAVLNTQGSNLFNGEAFLTGNVVDVQQASSGVVSFAESTWFWIIVLVILVVVIYFLFKRSRKQRFSKRINLNKNFRLRDSIVVSNGQDAIPTKNKMVGGRNIAEFSPSIQGEKQASSIVCIDIKNFEEVRSGKGGVNETMNRLKSVADESNAAVYENGSYLFFVFAPINTKELNNEMNAIEAAQKARKILEDHNRLMKQKIHFGISVNCGNIIAKHGMNGLKFMTLGNLISIAKKLAALSQGEVLLSKEIKNRVATDVKTEMRTSGDLEFYPLTEIRNREKSQKFIKEFMSKMEKEEKERSNRP